MANQDALADELTKAMGKLVDQSRVSRWESGESLPSPKYRAKLLEVLKEDESFFKVITPIEEETRSKAESLGLLTGALATLDESQLGAVIKFVEDAFPWAFSGHSTGSDS